MDPQESMRLCPTCRMAISVLATRCRFCGEDVGRPKQGEKLFTIQDLGGENPTNYTVSGNVLDALESFRAEQLSAQEADRREKSERTKSWIGRRSSIDGEVHIDSGSGLPELDEQHRSLADTVESSPKLARPTSQAVILEEMKTYGLYALGGLAAILLLYFGWQGVSNYLEGRNQVEELVIPNHALTILARGEGALPALEEAMNVLRQAPSEENREIAETVRESLIEEVEALLNATSWDRSILDQASRIATRAAVIDPARRIQDLQREVDEEVAAYKMIAVSIDSDAETATFRLHNPNFPLSEETVSAGDWVQDRFIVRRVYSNYVRLEDTRRRAPGGSRTVLARLNSQVTSE